MPEVHELVVWCGLTRHHAMSAIGLPQDTESILTKLLSGSCPMVGDLMLEPIGRTRSAEGFGVVLERRATVRSPHHVRTRDDLPTRYARRIQQVRKAFRELGFTRAAQLYVSVEDRTYD